MLIDAGKIIAGGSPGELKNEYLTSPIIEVECNAPLNALEILEDKEWINEVSMFGNNLHINIKDEESGVKNLKKLFLKNSIEIKKIEKITPSLEDVFIHLIENK